MCGGYLLVDAKIAIWKINIRDIKMESAQIFFKVDEWDPI
jgi:hypothetical protein